MGGAYGTRGWEEWCMLDLVGIPDGKIPLGRPRHGWEDIIKMAVKLVWRTWTGLIWLRIATGGALLWVRLRTSGFHKFRENFFTGWGSASFSRTLLHVVSWPVILFVENSTEIQSNWIWRFRTVDAIYTMNPPCFTRMRYSPPHQRQWGMVGRNRRCELDQVKTSWWNKRKYRTL